MRRSGRPGNRTLRGRLSAAGPLVELSHVIRAGIVTYPGLPGPEITPYLTRDASREHYAPGTEFAIDRLTLPGSTGTYLDAPYHRYPGGADLSGIPLARTADLPAVVVRGVERHAERRTARRDRLTIETPHGPRTCVEAVREGNQKPLVARFGGIPLKRQKTAAIIDRVPGRDPYPRKEIITRLRGGLRRRS